MAEVLYLRRNPPNSATCGGIWRIKMFRP